MSVDISHLSAHLPDAQRIAIQAEYERRAKSPTAAFLLCFFLGIFGAHRFYLRQPGAGVLRLILSPLVIPGIILEIVDLFHIDREVNALNLNLAEELVAANALDTHSPAVAAAVAQLNAARQAEQQPAQPAQPAAGQSAQAPSVPATSTPPPALEATVVTPISGDPGTPATSTIELQQDAPPIWPIDAEVATITAAAAAAAVAEGADSAAGPEPSPEPPSAPAMPTDALDITPEMVAQAAAAADAEAPLSQGQATALPSLDDTPAEPVPSETMPSETMPAEPVPSETMPSETMPVEPVPSETMPGVAMDGVPAAETPVAEAGVPATEAIPPLHADLTDAGYDDTDSFDLADLGEPTGKRVVVRLPDLTAATAIGAAGVAAVAAPDWTDTSPVPASMPNTDTAPPSAETTDVMPVDVSGGAPSDVPDGVSEDVSDGIPEDAGSMEQPLAEETASMLLLPVEPLAVEPSGAPPAPVAAETPEVFEPPVAAEAATAAAAGDGYQADVSEELHDRWTDTGSHRIVKRVKVVRRLVINGQVVEEATAEQVVDADADTSATARNLQESLRSGDIQQRIAALSTPLPSPADDSTGASTPSDSTPPPAPEG